MEKDSRGRNAWGHYLLVMVLLCATIVSFFAFSRENQTRIAGQNQKYAHDATTQAASRVEDTLETRATTLNLLSITVAETIKEPWIGQDFLKLLQETSVFDYVEFIDADGLNHNADGVTSDSSDRKNYLRGIQGETGFHVIYNSRITHETLVNFYAPVHFHGEIIGVLNGMLREKNLRQAISVNFFDADAKSLICMEDGTVISSYGYNSPVENLLDGLAQDDVAPEALPEIQDAFAAHEAICCTARGKSEDVSISLAPIGDDWMLVQTFPPAVTKQMEANANSAGIKLELRLVTLFLIYVTYLIITNLHKRRQLTSEKVRLNGIVEGLAPLFSRLVIIEPERQSYEYLKGAPPDLPAQGTVASLEHYMSSHYLPKENEDPSFIKPTMEEIKTALGKGAPFLQYEYRVRWDEERWETASVLNLRQKGSVPVSLIFAIQDVTALQQQKDAMQQALRDSFHTAEDLSRAKSDFLSRMSHDMRTPMNAVLGMASIALSHLDDSGRVRDCLEKIDASGRQLLSLINEVLDMSKIESGGMVLDEAQFDLKDKLDLVLDEVRNAATKKDLRLDVDITPFDHSAVLGDSKRFQQVLRNLLDNAVKYTPPGGVVTFRARELPSRASKSGYYEFVVEDTGMGIDPAFQPKIFEPFVRGEVCRGDLGTGLGLSIAQTIARLMNGDIKAESEPGHGSKFTVYLFLKLEEEIPPHPFTQKETRQVDPVGAEGKPKPVTRHAGIRVLLVEDIEINRIIAREMLKKAGLLVETAENGKEAVTLVQNNPPAHYDLIFMDLQMPVMDGYEASQAIRGSGREDLLRIPIVAVTANAFQEDVSRAKDAGMNDLVMKPVDLDRLLAALDKWLPKGSARNGPASEPV